MNSKHFGISYGALADPIGEQIKEQGYKFDKKTVDGFQQMIDAANTLRFGSLIPDSVFGKIIEKLHKKIVSHVVKQNKLKQVS